MKKWFGFAAAIAFSISMASQAFAGTAGAVNFSCDVTPEGTVQAVLIDFTQGTGLKNYQMYELAGTGEGITFTVDQNSLKQELQRDDIKITEIQYGILGGNGGISYYFGSSGKIVSELYTEGASYNLLGGNTAYPDSNYAIIVKYKDVYDTVRNHLLLIHVSGVASEQQLLAEGLRIVDGENKYQKADGTYAMNEWKWVGEKCYYFDTNGNMLKNSVTPDGYQVGNDGAWIA